jgi:hypothetical protein
MDFSNSKIDLKTIEANESQEYLFSLEASFAPFDHLKLKTSFELILNFNCQQNDSQSAQSVQSMVASQTAAVLAASTAAQPPAAVSLEQSNKLSNLIYLCGSCLFVLVFFVIIKFINGKKKKNQ